MLTMSNSKLGVAGEGGVILCPDNKIETQYAWGLGVASNNQAEYLALWQGLETTIEKKISKILVFGDYDHDLTGVES